MSDDITSSAGFLGEFTCVAGQSFCISADSGQVRPGGDQGLFVRDVRVLNSLVLRVGSGEPVFLRSYRVGASAARFTGFVPLAGTDREPDPRLVVDRRRVVSDSLWEQVRCTNYGTIPAEFLVEFEAGTDFASIFDVKHGRQFSPALVDCEPDCLRFFDPREGLTALVWPSAPTDESSEGTLRWRVSLAARESWSVALSVGYEEPAGAVWPTREWGSMPPADDSAPLGAPDVRCADVRVRSLIRQSVADLCSLLIEDPISGRDHFFAAGSPWFLTLFGRDSLWAAFMALPLGTTYAAQTLRVLARLQGRREDAITEEEPGKILHELRSGSLSERADLPPRYYGTIDATPLFVILLAEAWRWGMPEAEVEALLPAAEAALAWMRDYGDPDGDGFLEYARRERRSLVNQGWKDSVDAISFADGRLAEPPIALCEVQGYAHQAATSGARLLEHFGRGGSDEWHGWAEAMAERFRKQFWVEDAQGAYPALALDRDKRRVDAVASNMGHLLLSDMLTEEETGLIARRLAGPDMNSGWGLRTLSASSPRFNPLSYHGGSVWPHDTAIAVAGLVRCGHVKEGSALLDGLVAAAEAFGYRLPELFGGEQRSEGIVPLPYPAACRPQAWSAGAALLLLRTALGLDPDVPAGRVALRAIEPALFGRLMVQGLPLADEQLSISLEDGTGVTVFESPSRLRVDVLPPVGDADAVTSGRGGAVGRLGGLERDFSW